MSTAQDASTNTPAHTNALIRETSPYLLQHAHNPVDWRPWGEAAFEQARRENKLVLVSIGYSACHWCHVMEHQSFENEAIAELMNRHFINIKVDREERPDVDQIYMEAVQLMRGQGGWPLNCFTLPDGRPIYGGTYFPPEQWTSVLQQLADFFQNKPEKADEYASNLTEHINQLDKITAYTGELPAYTLEDLTKAWIPFYQSSDHAKGGPDRAPKFPLPSNWEFALEYAHATQDPSAQNLLQLTLEQMAWGGLYDQVGGGFARYSTDKNWFLPHFEKMLYDNGQLVALYSRAWRADHRALYADVVHQTLDFVERELTHPQGGFYSALDADSEGEEGKFYVWTLAEVQEVLGEADAKLYAQAYNLSERGNWEHGANIPHRNRPLAELAEELDLPLEQLRGKLELLNAKLLERRADRVRPGLDDKILAGWNGLMVRGYLEAYRSFGRQEYREVALKNLQFLFTEMTQGQGQLYRSWKDGQPRINAYLDDYAAVIDACLAAYTVTFDEQYLAHARAYTQHVWDHFDDPQSGFFYYTSDLDDPLIARKKELQDNVIPSSNAMMARNLLHLGRLDENAAYQERAQRMLALLEQQVQKSLGFMSEWGRLMLQLAQDRTELALVGPEAVAQRQQIDEQAFLPQVLLLGAQQASSLPLLQGKFQPEATHQYVCTNKVCSLPLSDLDAALKQAQNTRNLD